MHRLRAAMIVIAVASLSACAPSGGGVASVSPLASAPAHSTTSASPSPSPSATPGPSASPAAGDGTAGSTGVGHDVGADARGWVNGYLLPGATDIHFGPDWGPTWYFTKTIGQHFTDWSAYEYTVDSSCPWAAGLDTNPETQVFSVAVGDPGGDPSIALMFRMGNPDDASVPHPMNGEGITVGTPMDEVLATYPGTTVQFFNDEAWGDVYEIDVFQAATDTHMFFWSWTPHGVVEYIQWGNFPNEVSWRGHTCGG